MQPWITQIGSCRRAFISLLGGIADNMYRGEGVLVDFDQGREIARDKGDPGADYEDYGGGKGLPVFCKPEQVAGYVRALLSAIDVEAN